MQIIIISCIPATSSSFSSLYNICGLFRPYDRSFFSVNLCYLRFFSFFNLVISQNHVQFCALFSHLVCYIKLVMHLIYFAQVDVSFAISHMHQDYSVQPVILQCSVSKGGTYCHATAFPLKRTYKNARVMNHVER